MNLPGVNPAYWEIIRLRLHEMIAYPFQLAGEWVKLPFTIVIYYIIYGTIFQLNPSFANTDLSTLLTYLTITFAFSQMGDAIHEGYQINQEIKQGAILTYVTRPISYFGVRLSKQMGRFLAMCIPLIPFIIIVTPLLGQTLYLDRLVIGFMVATLGSIVLFQLHYLTSLLAFWLEEVWGFRWALSTITFFFSGAMVPITLFPPLLQQFSYVLPFVHQAGIPAQFMLGQVGWESIGRSLGIIVVWMTGLLFLNRWVWHLGLLKHDGKG